MEMMPKTKIDPSKITGKFPLLALFLLVVEVLLGIWLYKAESINERVIAGLFMTSILIYFLIVVKRMQEDISKPIVPQGLDNEVTPAQKEVTKEEVDSPEPQMIGAPDRSYIINKPPERWVVQELTFNEWRNRILKITDPSLKETEKSLDQEILTFSSRREISVIPIPGKTLIDGRKHLTALEVTIPTELSIIPMERWDQPPLFVEHSLIHNFLNNVGKLLNVGVMTMHNVSLGTIPNSKRQYLVAEFHQEIENVIVNDKEEKNINHNVTIIGIGGDLRDYLLYMNYLSPVVDDPELKQDLQMLQLLVSSFQPLKVINPDKQKMENKKKADQEFKTFKKENGTNLFYAEFELILLRLKDLDVSDPEKRLKMIKLLKPFEVFSKEINLQDDELDALWNSLHQAEEGNATTFKDKMKQMITSISSEAESDQEDLHSLTSVSDEKNMKHNEEF